MYLRNHTNDSLILSSLYSATRSSITYRLNISKQSTEQRNTTNTNTTIWLLPNSSIQQQRSSHDEAYSVKTGIRIAILLGGMLAFFVLYLLWKASRRLCCCSPSSSSTKSEDNNSHLPSTKFDLDYWLKQVDLREAREAECNREELLPYLQLPTEEPRNNEAATALWIADACRQWYFIQYRQQLQVLRHTTTQLATSDPHPYPRRRYMLRRFFRRLLIRSNKNILNIDPNSSILITDLRSSIVNMNLVPPPEALGLQPRRVASWPRLKSHNDQNGATISGLQARIARKRLLKQLKKNECIG